MTYAHILVAEDNYPNQMLIKTYLRKIEFSCLLVKNGREAISAIDDEDFDLVLMDIQMPQMDGLEATRRIRAMDGVARNIPIVGLTASVHEDALQRCLEAGMNAVITKPVKAVVLYEQIKQFIQ